MMLLFATFTLSLLLRLLQSCSAHSQDVTYTCCEYLMRKFPDQWTSIVVYSMMRFVVRLTMCHFVLVFFSPFSIVITSLGEERANLSAFRMFVRFVLVWICRFPLPLGVWEGLRFVIVALPGLFSYLFWGKGEHI